MMIAQSPYCRLAAFALAVSGLTLASARADMTAYEKTVYKYVRQTTTCVKCHDPGIDGAPRFATGDVAQSYKNALSYANRYNPNFSQFVIRSKNGHCGESLCQTDGKAMLAALKDWLATDSDAFPALSNRIVSNPLKVTFKPDDKTFQKYRFTFDHDVMAEVELRLVGNTFLEARLPRIASAKSGIYVRDIQFLVDGGSGGVQSGEGAGLNLAEGFVNASPALSTLGATDAFPARILDVRASLMPEQELKPDTVINVAMSLGVMDVNPPGRECLNIESFTKNVKELFERGGAGSGAGCVSCHHKTSTYPGSAAAKRDFLLTDDDWTNCTNTLMHVNTADMKQSTFVRMYFGITAGPGAQIHQPQGIPGDKPAQRLIDWLDGK